MDPGILPRSYIQYSKSKSRNKIIVFLYLKFIEKYATNPFSQNQSIILYMGTKYKFKYCITCGIIRPPKCSHCSICNSCFLRTDHHCPWLGTCVAQRNYIFFLLFILHSFLVSFFDGIISAFHIIWHISQEKQFNTNLICSAFCVLLGLFGVFFIGNLVILHIKLISKGITTRENVHRTYEKKVNPLDRGSFCANLKAIILRYSRQKSKFWPITSGQKYCENVAGLAHENSSSSTASRKIFPYDLSEDRDFTFGNNYYNEQANNKNEMNNDNLTSSRYFDKS